MVVWVRMAVSVSVVYPYNHMADWELRVPDTAQNHKRIPYHILLAREKTNSKCKVWFLLNAYCFTPL